MTSDLTTETPGMKLISNDHEADENHKRQERRDSRFKKQFAKTTSRLDDFQSRNHHLKLKTHQTYSIRL